MAENRAEALTGEGITILAPDVNLSRKITAPAGPMAVRLGLGEVKGVGTLGEMVVDVRESSFPFDSLSELVRRLNEHSATKTASIAGVEGLVESGACDDFGPRLGQMMVARAVKSNRSMKVPDAEWGLLERAMRQRARLGISLGEHPVVAYRQAIEDYRFRPEGAQTEDNEPVGDSLIRIKDIPDSDGASVYVGGLLAQWGESAYSKGQRANIVLEGSKLRIGGVMWDSELKLVPVVPTVGMLVAVQAKVTMRSRDIEDEEGTVIETLVTKELTVRQVEVIPVDDRPTGAFMAALAAPPAGVLPDVPVLALLKLPPKPKAGKPTAPNPERTPPKAKAAGPETPTDPEPEPAAPAPSIAPPPVNPEDDYSMVTPPQEEDFGWSEEFEAQFDPEPATPPADVVDSAPVAPAVPLTDAEADAAAVRNLLSLAEPRKTLPPEPKAVVLDVESGATPFFGDRWGKASIRRLPRMESS